MNEEALKLAMDYMPSSASFEVCGHVNYRFLNVVNLSPERNVCERERESLRLVSDWAALCGTIAQPSTHKYVYKDRQIDNRS